MNVQDFTLFSVIINLMYKSNIQDKFRSFNICKFKMKNY